MVMSWSVILIISLALVKCQNRVLDPMSAMRDDISRIKVTMESVEEQLEKFNSLYLGKLESRVVAVANSLGHIDSNVKNLQERAHVWDTFQLHVSAWNEQIKAVDKKLDLLNRGYDKWEAMSDKVSQLPATEVALNKILGRLDELDLKFIDIQRKMNSTVRTDQPLLPEFAGRGVLSTLKDIETKVTKIQSDSKQCGHHTETAMQREILTMVNDMAGKIDFLVDKVPVKRNAKDDDPGDVDLGDEDYPEHGASEDEIKRNPEKEFIKLWRKMVHPFRKANKKFEMLDRVLVEMEKFVNASNIATRDSSPLLSEIQSDILQINQCCKNNDVYLKNGIKTLENAVDGVSVSVSELLRGNEKCNSFYQEQIQQQTYEIKNVLRSILSGKEVETKDVDVFLESRGREETVTSTEPTIPPPYPQQTSCHELRASGETQNKVYRVSTKELNDAGQDYNMRYCDMTTEGGGWTVIQRRGYFGEPMQNFSLGWQEYRYGFGDLSKEFWFGNDYIHRLTNEYDNVLRIDLWDFEGNKVYAEYETFKIDSEDDQYRLWVGGYKGNASDSFSTHSGYAFSTWDRDNDEAPPCCPCAPAYGGGWWFYSCFEANLNGAYHRKPTDNDYYRGIIWEMWRGDYSLRAAEMKIRPRTFSAPSQGVTEELIPEDP